MFIKILSVKNFRCFGADAKNLEFKVPDGENEGSGLNIFVGENGSGKTTVLEAIDLLTKNPFSAKNRIDVSDFNHGTQEKIEIEATTDQQFEVKRLWGTNSFNCKGLYFYAKLREKDEKGRLLDPIMLDTEFVPVKESQIKPVEKRQTASGPYGTGRLQGFDIFYFDKNRSRHLTSGTYKTKFEEVMDDLNFQFLTSLVAKTDEERKKIAGWVDSTTEKIHGLAKDKVVSKTVEKINNFFSMNNFRLVPC